MSGVIAHGAGVGGGEAVGGDTADESGDGTEAGGAACAIGAVGDGGSVTAPGGVEEDDAPANAGRGKGVEFVKGFDGDDLGGDAFGRGGDAAAKAKHAKRSGDGGEKFGALFAAHPVGDHDLGGFDAGEAVAAHFGGAPFEGLFEGFGAGETGADAVAEVFEASPALLIGERGADQLGGAGAEGFSEGSGGHQRRGQEGEERSAVHGDEAFILSHRGSGLGHPNRRARV